MDKFKPRAGKGFVKGLRVVKEAAGNLVELRVEAQRQVGDQHGRLAFFLRIKRVWNNFRAVFRFELNRACRAAGLHPLIFVQVFEEVVAPLGRRLRPDHFQTGGDRVGARAAAVAVRPAESLRFNRRRFRLCANVAGHRGTVGFAQRMTAGDQRDDLFIIHCHIAEGRANRGGGGERVAAGVGAFRVDVNQPHFCRANGLLIQAFRMTMGQPFGFITPVNVQIRFPYVFTTGPEAKGAETGVFQRHVACQHIEVGPGDFLPVLLFYRPQQATGFVEADVIRPGIERCETLLAAARAAAPVNGTIGTGAVPRHTNKQPNIATPVRWPPLLRIGEQGAQIGLQGRVVELLKLFAVVKVFAQRV